MTTTMTTPDTDAAERRELPEGWRWVRLGDVCILNPPRPPLQRNEAAATTFVPMPAVDEHSGAIEKAEIRPFAEVRKGYTYFAEGDVLFAKIIPCMQNGKHAVARNLIDKIGFGSTEFHVVRPEAEITSDWIHRFLRQPWVLQAATAHFTGAVGQQRVPADFLANLTIPLPPLPEQRRIAALLDEALSSVAQARAAAEARLQAARALPAAFLREVFESEEAQGWDRRNLGEVCDIVAPLVDPRTPKYGVLPHINGENIESGTSRLLPLRTAAEDKMISGKYVFEAGDILYSKLRPYLRKVVVAEFRGLCSADMYPIKARPDILNPYFLAWTLLSDEFTHYADEESRRTRMPKLNREQLFSWQALVPPLHIQEHIVNTLSNRIAASEGVVQFLKSQLAAIAALPAALLRRAFAGEL